MGIKAIVIGRKTIKYTNSMLNLLLLIITMLLLSYATYALWDSNQIHKIADKSNYSVYKPTEINEGKSFKELQKINPEVFAWLTVYGTNIDYPITQGIDNMKYINTSAEGFYSLSGAIFLDSGNSKSFDDFNSIFYGHHMAKKAMFGEIGTFSNEANFNSHRYGNLYFNGRNKGIEFFAFLHCDAYNTEVFTAGVGENNRQEYLNSLFKDSMYLRDVDVTINDHIILLSTCSSTSTNGRDILIGKLTDKTYTDTFINSDLNGNGYLESIDSKSCIVKKTPIPKIFLGIFLAVLILSFTIKSKRNRGKYI